jgi:hypothetical protein
MILTDNSLKHSDAAVGKLIGEYSLYVRKAYAVSQQLNELNLEVPWLRLMDSLGLDTKKRIRLEVR